MIQPLPDQDAVVFIQRRVALSAATDGCVSVIFAGGDRPRNFPANAYPYRANSHFLYLTGASLPGAILVIEAGKSLLFVEPATAAHALWHGPRESDAELLTVLGVDEICALDAFEETMARRNWSEGGTIASNDPCTLREQEACFGRSPGVNPSPLDEVLLDAMIALRSTHDEAALSHLRKAADATTSAFLAGMRATTPGLLEAEIRAIMECELSRREMPCAYNSIVTVHGEVLHNNLYHHTLGADDMLLVDMGGESRGWACDVTRTWPTSGKFSSTQKALYEVVLQAELDAIAMVRPGVRYQDIHLKAALTITEGLVDLGILCGVPEDLVARNAHALFFPHGVGHLLGLDVHDMEDLGDRAGYAPGRQRAEPFGLCYLRLDRDMVPGMLVTIEPGIYLVPAILNDRLRCEPFDRDGTLNRTRLAQFSDVRGIRIEDDILCTEGAPEILTSGIPKSIHDLENIIGNALSASN